MPARLVQTTNLMHRFRFPVATMKGVPSSCAMFLDARQSKCILFLVSRFFYKSDKMGDKYYCHVLLRLINNEHTRSVCFFLRSPRLSSERISESETSGNIHLLRLLVFVLSLSLRKIERDSQSYFTLSSSSSSPFLTTSSPY